LEDGEVIEIKHRFTGETIYTFNGDSLQQADLRRADLSEANLREANLRWADLSGADLRGADLSGANLSGANLSEANLSGANLSEANLRWADLSGADLSGIRIFNAIGDGAVIRSMQLPRYIVNVCDDWLQIGCKGHRLHEWGQFDDETITRMDEGALEWWREWKDVVLAFADCP